MSQSRDTVTVVSAFIQQIVVSRLQVCEQLLMEEQATFGGRIETHLDAVVRTVLGSSFQMLFELLAAPMTQILTAVAQQSHNAYLVHMQ